MDRDLRFVILNRDEQFGGELRAMLLGLGGVKIVAELDEAAMLAQAARQFSVDVVFVNLDPAPDAILPLLGELASENNSLSIFATSESTDGQLILQAMRVGVREFLPKPIDEAQLQQAMEKTATTGTTTVEHGKLITVMGASGGVGATTIAANLACELAAFDNGEVTVVDLDHRFGQVATVLDVEPAYTVADLCASPEELEKNVVDRALVRHECGARVLARPANFAQADTITAAACVGLLSKLLEFNRYVVADGPNRFDASSKSVLDLSDVNLIVVQMLVPCIRNAIRILDGMREAGYNLDNTKLICNRVGRDTGHLSAADVAETLNLEVFAEIPDDWSAVSNAINLGEPLTKNCPKSKVRSAIQTVAEALLVMQPQTGQAEEHDGQKKGLISRIFAS